MVVDEAVSARRGDRELGGVVVARPSERSSTDGREHCRSARRSEVPRGRRCRQAVDSEWVVADGPLAPN